MLADHGIPIQDHQTAREFGAGVRRVLRIPLQPLMRLTGLFEEARYSLHEIDEEKRDEALQRLTDVRDYLMGEAAIGETYG